jgi:hypothetical protein
LLMQGVHHLLALDEETRLGEHNAVLWRFGIAIVGAMVTVVLRRGSGVGVMWCGSRAQGGNGLLKLALDPADEARRCIDLRKAGCFTKCTLTAGPIQHFKDGWSLTTLCSCTTRAPRVYSAAWQRVSRARGGTCCILFRS